MSPRERACFCGHTRDEHEIRGACAVDDCACAGYDPDFDDDEEEA